MNAKIVIAVLAILVVAAIYVFMQPSGTQSTETADQNIEAQTSEPVTEQTVNSAIDESYSSVIQEELNSMTYEQDDYSASATDDIAQDMSSFYE